MFLLPFVLTVGGISERSHQDSVGLKESIQEVTFEAPVDSEEVTLMEVFTANEHMRRKQAEYPKMIYIPAAKGGHSFYIDPHEVTNNQYYEFVKATGRKAPKGWINRRPPIGMGDYAVTGVTYEDAEDFAKWVGKRLPTEAEWEIAAKLSEQNPSTLTNFRNEDPAIPNVGEWTDNPDSESFKTVCRGKSSPNSLPSVQKAPMHRDDSNSETGFRCASENLPGSSH